MATTQTKIKKKNKMESKEKSSNEVHSEPLQQCSVVGSASSKEKYLAGLNGRESVAVIDADYKNFQKRMAEAEYFEHKF